VLIGHGPNKAFLVPDSCRVTERNGNSISIDVTEDTIETSLWQLFSDNLAGVLDFLILQDKLNMCTLSLNIKLICTFYETG
jgi:hypothetical protein